MPEAGLGVSPGYGANLARKQLRAASFHLGAPRLGNGGVICAFQAIQQSDDQG